MTAYVRRSARPAQPMRLVTPSWAGFGPASSHETSMDSLLRVREALCEQTLIGPTGQCRLLAMSSFRSLSFAIGDMSTALRGMLRELGPGDVPRLSCRVSVDVPFCGQRTPVQQSVRRSIVALVVCLLAVGGATGTLYPVRPLLARAIARGQGPLSSVA